MDFANGLTSVFPSPLIVLYPYPSVSDLALQRTTAGSGSSSPTNWRTSFTSTSRGAGGVSAGPSSPRAGALPQHAAADLAHRGARGPLRVPADRWGRAEGSYQAAVVAAQIAEFGALTIDAANAASPRWPGGYRPYAFGGAFFAALTAQHGDSVMERLAGETATAPLPYVMLDRSLRRAAGLSFSRAWRSGRRGWSKVRSLVTGVRPATRRRSDRPIVRRYARPLVRPPCAACAARSCRASRRTAGASSTSVTTGATRRGSPSSTGRREPSRPWHASTAGSALPGTPAAPCWPLSYEFSDPYSIHADLYRVTAGGRERRLTHGARLSAPDVGADGTVLAVHTDAGRNSLVRWSAGEVTVLRPAEPGVEWPDRASRQTAAPSPRRWPTRQPRRDTLRGRRRLSARRHDR